MATILEYIAGSNSLSVTENGVTANVAGTGIDNAFTAPQTFDSTINQSPGAGASNQGPFLQAADAVQDYIVSGINPGVPSPASLTMTIPAGTAFVLGQRTILQAAVADTYPASSDTYFSMTNTGQVAYTSVANGAAAPAAPANAVNLLKVVTNATGIIYVEQLIPNQPFTPTVSSMAEFRSLVTDSNIVFVSGYYTPGDGGGGTFVRASGTPVGAQFLSTGVTPIPNPTVAPSVTVSANAIVPLPGIDFTIPNGTVYVAIAYITAAGESLVSPTTAVTVNGTTITVTAPASPPAGVTDYAVYMGTSSSSLYLQKLLVPIGTDWVQPTTVGLITWGPAPLTVSGAGSIMTVSSIISGSLLAPYSGGSNFVLTQPGFVSGIYIASQLTGTSGSVGTYVITQFPTFEPSTIIIADDGGVNITTNNGQNFLRDYGFGKKNIRWFGAMGNSVFDDSWPTRAALNGFPGSSIHIPHGSFYFLTPLLNVEFDTGFFGDSTPFETGAGQSVVEPRTAFILNTSIIGLDGISFDGGFNPVEASSATSIINCSFSDWTNAAILHTIGEKFIFDNIFLQPQNVSSKIGLCLSSVDLSLTYIVPTAGNGTGWMDRASIGNVYCGYTSSQFVRNFIYAQNNVSNTVIEQMTSMGVSHYIIYIGGSLEFGSRIDRITIDGEGYSSYLSADEAQITIGNMVNSVMSNFPIGNGYANGPMSLKVSSGGNNIFENLTLNYGSSIGSSMDTLINVDAPALQSPLVTNNSTYIGCSINTLPQASILVPPPGYNLIPNAAFTLGVLFWTATSPLVIANFGTGSSTLNSNTAISSTMAATATVTTESISSEIVPITGNTLAVCALTAFETADTSNPGITVTVNFYNSTGGLLTGGSYLNASGISITGTSITNADISGMPIYTIMNRLSPPAGSVSANVEISFNTSLTDAVTLFLTRVKLESGNTTNTFSSEFSDDTTFGIISGIGAYNPGLYITPKYDSVTLVNPATLPGEAVNLGQADSLYRSSMLTLSSTTTSGAITATAAQLAGQYLADGATQTAAFTVTTDTAVNILAAMPNAVVGTSFKWRFINNDQSATGYAGTLAGGTGVTVGTILPNPGVPKGGYEDYVFTFTAIGSTPTLTVEAVGGSSAALL